MASESVCEINLAGLTKQEAEAVKRQVKAVVDRAVGMSDMTQLDDAISESMKSYEAFVNAAAMVQKRNAYLNKIKTKKVVDYVLGNWDGDEIEGMISFLVGGQTEKFGARESVENAIGVFQNRYKSYFSKALYKEDLVNHFASGSYDKDIHVAMDRLHKGLPLDGVNATAIKIAKIIDNTNKMIRNDANSHGAFIRELDGFIVTRGHDHQKIKANRELWKKYMIEKLDFEKSLVGLSGDELDNWLSEQWIEFSSGVHLADDLNPDASGLKGFSSIAKRMSKSRVFHFKTPEDEYEYMKLFGHETLFDAINWSLESRGRSVGIMSKLGPNAEMNLEAARNEILKAMKKSKAPGVEDRINQFDAKFKKRVMREIWPTLTGKTATPGTEIGALVEATALALQRTTLLGGSAWASLFGDSAVSSFNVARLEKGFSGWMRGYKEYFSYFGKNIHEENVMDFISDAAINSDFITAWYTPRWSEHSSAFTKGQRRIAKAENLFFFMNGQYYVDSRARVGAAVGLSERIARRLDKDFDALDDGYKRLFDTNGITKNEWEVARLSRKDFNGFKILDIEGIKDLDESVIDNYIVANGLKPSKYQRKKAIEDIISKFRNVYLDQQAYTILSPGARLRSFMYGGDQAGEGWAMTKKLLWQFKGFPMSYLEKVWGREIHSKSPTSDKFRNIAAVTLATTIGAYISMNVRDILAGKEPKEFSGKVVYESFLRGGGLGIVGDLAYQMYNENFGQSAAAAVLGPTFADVGTLVNVGSGVFQGDMEKSGDAAAKFVTSNIPFSNVFWLKPVFDYAFLNAIKEEISPGSLLRTENRLANDYGQEYFMLRPSETMLFQ